MKKKFWKRAAAFFVSAALLSVALPLSASAMTYYQYLAGDLPSWETNGPGCSITVYQDAEQTKQILDHEECTPGETYYYKVVCPEGWYMNALAGDFDHMDTEKVVFEEEFYFIPHLVLAGDFKADGTVDLKDVSGIIRHCAGFRDPLPSYDESLIAGDFNRDSLLDMKDVAELIRVLAGLVDNPHGGTQSDFSIMRDPYMVGVPSFIQSERNIKTPAIDGEPEEKATLITSAEEFKEFLKNAVDASYYEERIADFDEEFFAEYDIIAASILSPDYKSFSYFMILDGVPTFLYSSYDRSPSSYPTLRDYKIYLIEKGLVSEDDGFQFIARNAFFY